MAVSREKLDAHRYGNIVGAHGWAPFVECGEADWRRRRSIAVGTYGCMSCPECPHGPFRQAVPRGVSSSNRVGLPRGHTTVCPYEPQPRAEEIRVAIHQGAQAVRPYDKHGFPDDVSP